MNKTIAFTIADNNNMPMAKQMINSLRKFHSEEELPVMIVDEEKISSYNDPSFFYRATPIIASELIEHFDTVIKLDADQIIMGDLNYILSKKDFTVGVVYNYNRTDPKTFGLVSVFNIDPREYYNCGFVVMRSDRFVRHWKDLCFTKYFNTLQYREQDILNVMCHYGDYKVWRMDDKSYDDYNAWHGLVSKGEGLRMELRESQVILPADENYNKEEKIIKVYHYAGGGHEPKNHRIYFNESMINHIDWLISNGKDDDKKT